MVGTPTPYSGIPRANRNMRATILIGCPGVAFSLNDWNYGRKEKISRQGSGGAQNYLRQRAGEDWPPGIRI